MGHIQGLPLLVSNHMPNKVWDEITYPFQALKVAPLKFGNG